MFSPSEANNWFSCSGHSFSGRFNKTGAASKSLLARFSMLIALVPTFAGLLIPLTCFHCENKMYFVSHVLDRPQTLVLAMETVYPVQCSSLVWPQKVQLLIFISCSLTICSSAWPPWLSLAFPIGVLKDALLLPIYISQWKMLSQLNISLVGILDRPLHASCLQMRQQTHEVWFLSLSVLKYLLLIIVSATIGSCCSISSNLLLHHSPFRYPNVVQS